MALLPFENLSGDPALDWVASAAPSIVAEQLIGVDRVCPLQVGAVSDAYLAQSNRLVHGYFTGRGEALHFQVEVEDAASHKMVATTAADGPILDAMSAVARRIDPAAHSFSSSNMAAIEAWGRGENERAVALDPDFALAWLAWVQALAASGDTQRALGVAAQALARPSLRFGAEGLPLEVASATLRKDAAARTKALTAWAMVTTDTETLRELAGAEIVARRFAAGAELYRTLLRIAPGDSQSMNLLGYAEAFAGNLDAAKKAFEQYQRQPGQEANAFDSQGEAYFSSGRFAEAEKFFLDAQRRDAAMLGGGDLLKAAYAHWLGGDLKGADAIFRRYLDFRATLHDPLLVWRESAWLYTTGRTNEAIAKLESAPASPLVTRQLAIWKGAERPPADLAALRDLYLRTQPAVDGEVRILYASALAAAGQKDEAKKLLSRWPIPDSGGDPLFQSLVFPRFLELRQNLGIK